MKQKQQQQIIITAIVGIVVLVAAVVIYASSRPASASDIAYEEIERSRAADGAFILGNPDAPITIVEFADFLCPFCQQYKPTMDQFVSEHVLSGEAKYEYRMLPTQQQSDYLARLAECADNQREAGFWYAYEELYAMARSGQARGDDVGRQLAQRLDINYTQLLECTMDANQVLVDQRMANNNGINSTPTLRMRLQDGTLQQVNPSRQGGAVPFDEISAAVAAAQLVSGS